MAVPDNQTILDAIAAAGNTFDPAAVRDEHQANKDLWRLYLDLVEPDKRKIEALLDKHHDGEPDAKFKLRQQLAVVIDLIPSIVRMIQGYVFSDEPIFDVKGDADLTAFLENCDGNGKRYSEMIRHRILPLSMVLGMTDVLVQRPLVDGAAVRSKRDELNARLRPTMFAVTPLQRINWSVQPNGAYNWLTFEDLDNESPRSLARNVPTPRAYITISAAEFSPDHGHWIRSWRQAPSRLLNAGGDTETPQWHHRVGFTPTRRASVATFYYQESIDPEQRHMGVSKIALMAVLTKQIIQVMSWLMEDVLANLALMAFPSKGGRKPLDEDGNDKLQELTALSILWFDNEAKLPPMVLQGNVEHIRVKMEIIDVLVREVLRLAHMIGASAEAEQVTSGVQGVVMRNELFQEITGIAAGLDSFTIDVFALVKSWATGTDITREKLMADKSKAPTAAFYKGPYTLDPIRDVIADAEKVVAIFRDVSPTMVESAYRQLARSYLYSADPALAGIIKEIETNTGKVVEAEKQREEELLEDAALSGAVDETDDDDDAAAEAA